MLHSDGGKFFDPYASQLRGDAEGPAAFDLKWPLTEFELHCPVMTRSSRAPTVEKPNMRTIMHVMLVMLLTAAVSNTALSQSADKPQSAHQFVGMWRLVSWTKEYDDGTVKQDPRSESYIIYTDNGRMCWVAMDPNRPNLSENPTEAEEATAYRGFGGYCAVVEIDLEDGYVVHHVDIARTPNAVGIDRKRWFQFDGPDRLHLRVDPTENVAPLIESSLVWERIK